MTRPLSEIAQDIHVSWPTVHHAARPYLEAMGGLNKITDPYFCDSARTVVMYFLANATSWRGPDARRVKAELKGLL